MVTGKRVCALIVALLLSALVLAPPSQAAPADYVFIRFDELPAKTELTTQYQPAGIASFTGPAALETAMATTAQEGCHQAWVSNDPAYTPSSSPHYILGGWAGPVEFATQTICMTLSKAQTGNASLRLSGQATVLAQLQNGQVQNLGLKGTNGSWTTVVFPLNTVAIGLKSQLSGGFAVDDVYVEALPGLVGTWAVMPVPSKGVRQGTTATVSAAVTHLYNNNAATNWSVLNSAALPAGVSATITNPNQPAATSSQTVNVSLTATPGAPVGDFNLILRGVNANKPAETKDVTIPTKVVTGVDLDPDTATNATPCSKATLGDSLSIPVSDSPPPKSIEVNLSGMVGFMTGGPTTLASFADKPNAWWEQQVTVPETKAGKVPVGVSYTINEQGQSYTISGTGTINVAPPELTIAPVASAAPYGPPGVSTPRWSFGGRSYTITAKSLCPDSTVTFGVSKPVPLTVAADGKSGTVALPPDATSGKVTLTDPAGNVSTVNLYGVTSARSQSLFPFANSSVPGGISWDRWVESYGSNQLQIDVNPCSWLTFGLADCSITKVADPIQYAVWSLGPFHSMGDKGLCFGHVMASDWYERGILSREGVKETTWPDNYRFVNDNNPALQAEIERRFITQASLDWVNYYPAPVTSPTDLVNQLNAIFATNNDAWLSVRNGGSGHIMRASRVYTDRGAVKVDLANSNTPYLKAEDTDAALHANKIAESTLTATPLSGGGFSVSMKAPSWNFTADATHKVTVFNPLTVPRVYRSPLSVPAQLEIIFSASSDPAELVDAAGKPVEQNAQPLLSGSFGDDAMLITGPASGEVYLKSSTPAGQSANLMLGRAGMTTAATQQVGSGGQPSLGVTADGAALLPPSSGGSRTAMVSQTIGTDRFMATLEVPAGLGLESELTKQGASFTATTGSGKLGVTLLQVTSKGPRPAVVLPAVRLGKGQSLIVPKSAYSATAGKAIGVKIKSGKKTVRKVLKGRDQGWIKSVKVKTKAGASKFVVQGKINPRFMALSGAKLYVSWKVRRGAKMRTEGSAPLTPATRIAQSVAGFTLRKGDIVSVGLVGLSSTGEQAVRETQVRVR